MGRFRVFITLCTIGLLGVLAAGCARDSSGVIPEADAQLAPPVSVPASDAAPSAAVLRRALDAQLALLGIDPAKVTSRAPSGPDDEAVDVVIDLVTMTGDPPLWDRVWISWSEALAGDYDQNSEVNLADLSALGLYYGQRVSYRDAYDGAGRLNVPVGDINWLGYKGSTYQFDATTLGNWRRARVDGDANGEINLADVTPLARHLGERLDGYRIYRRLEGASDWQLLPNPDNPASPLTISRATALAASGADADHTRPLRYSFFDVTPPLGLWQYKLVPYSIAEDSEGTPTLTLPREYNGTGDVYFQGDITLDKRYCEPGGTVNISYSIGTGTAPFTVKIDFDEDGVWDFVSANGADTIAHTYSQPGLKTIVLRGEDTNGRVCFRRRGLLVKANLPTVAQLSITPLDAYAPAVVHFDTAGTYDGDNGPLILNVTVDDRSIGTPTLQDMALQSTVIEPGVHTCKLIVTDQFNQQTVAEQQFTLLAGGSTDPAWRVESLAAVSAWANGIANPIDAQIIAGLPAAVYAEPTQLTYVSAADPQGTAWLAPHPLTDGTLGIVTSPQLADIAGQPAVAFCAYGPFANTLYMRANDALQSDWPAAPVSLCSSSFPAFPGLGVAGGQPLLSLITTSDGGYSIAGLDASGSAWSEPVPFSGGYDCRFLQVDGRPALYDPARAKFTLALDASATAWAEPAQMFTPDPNSMGNARVAVAAGRPCAVYPSREGIAYVRSADALGSAWYPPRVIIPVQSPRSDYYAPLPSKDLDIAVIGGQPWLCYYSAGRDLHVARAGDVAGLSWPQDAVVDNVGDAGAGCALIDVDGQPGVFYAGQAQQGGEMVNMLKFAVLR